MLKIRRALDELAVGLACDNMTEEKLEELYEALLRFEKSTRTGDVKQIAQTDIEFHEVIYQTADNPKLVNLLNNLREQMYRYRVEYLKYPFLSSLPLPRLFWEMLPPVPPAPAYGLEP